jgi:hypothetical protein
MYWIKVDAGRNNFVTFEFHECGMTN